MGGALEVAKLVMASWLYNNWNSPLLPKSIKYYLTSAVVVLVFITSVGIFGFLSKAHLDQVVPESNNALQIEIINEQIEQRQKTIDRSQKQLTRMDDLIETQSEETSWFTSSSQKAITERNNQKLERLSLEETIDQSLNKINELFFILFICFFHKNSPDHQSKGVSDLESPDFLQTCCLLRIFDPLGGSRTLRFTPFDPHS